MGKLATIAYAVTFAASVVAWIVLLAGNGITSFLRMAPKELCANLGGLSRFSRSFCSVLQGP